MSSTHIAKQCTQEKVDAKSIYCSLLLNLNSNKGCVCFNCKMSVIINHQHNTITNEHMYTCLLRIESVEYIKKSEIIII